MKQFIKTSEVNATCNSTAKGLALPKQQKSTSIVNHPLQSPIHSADDLYLPIHL